jgi:hypothetical protein
MPLRPFIGTGQSSNATLLFSGGKVQRYRVCHQLLTDQEQTLETGTTSSAA